MRGIEERLGSLAEDFVEHVDGGGDKATSRSAVKNFLRRHSRKKVLIAGINDESAIGAVEAARQVSGEVAIAGHGGSAEIIEIIRDADSPCIGTVSFHAELYGPGLVTFVVPTLRGRSAAPVHYVPHEFLAKEPSARGRTNHKPCSKSGNSDFQITKKNTAKPKLVHDVGWPCCGRRSLQSSGDVTRALGKIIFDTCCFGGLKHFFPINDALPHGDAHFFG